MINDVVWTNSLTRLLNFSWQIHLSLDDPILDGDHENIYGEVEKDLKVYDIDGNLYSDCQRLAINVRDIHSHIPWHSSGQNRLRFSDLRGRTKQYLRMSDIELFEARNVVQFKKTVKPSYG